MGFVHVDRATGRSSVLVLFVLLLVVIIVEVVVVLVVIVEVVVVLELVVVEIPVVLVLVVVLATAAVLLTPSVVLVLEPRPIVEQSHCGAPLNGSHLKVAGASLPLPSCSFRM